MNPGDSVDEPLITSRADEAMGKPCIGGTRITVEYVLESLAAGESFDSLLDAHPRLTRDGIRAALLYAAQSLESESVHPSGGSVA